MSKKRKWTYHDEQFLIDNYKYITVDEAASALDRSRPATARKIIAMQQKGLLPYKYKNKEQNRQYVESKRSRIGLKNVELTECPECGSSRINEVDYAYSTGVKFFCVNCLSEFDKYGKWIKPIL